jgi:hypothetical protein
MNMGQNCPIGGTHLSHGWDTFVPPVLISLIFLFVVSSEIRRG